MNKMQWVGCGIIGLGVLILILRNLNIVGSRLESGRKLKKRRISAEAIAFIAIILGFAVVCKGQSPLQKVTPSVKAHKTLNR